MKLLKLVCKLLDESVNKREVHVLTSKNTHLHTGCNIRFMFSLTWAELQSGLWRCEGVLKFTCDTPEVTCSPLLTHYALCYSCHGVLQWVRGLHTLCNITFLQTCWAADWVATCTEVFVASQFIQKFWPPGWSLETEDILVTVLLMMPCALRCCLCFMNGRRSSAWRFLFLHHDGHFASCDQSEVFVHRCSWCCCVLVVSLSSLSGYIRTFVPFSSCMFGFFAVLMGVWSFHTEVHSTAGDSLCLFIHMIHAIVCPEERGTFMCGPDVWTSHSCW